MVKMKLKTKIGADFNFTGNGFRKSDEFLPMLIKIFTAVRWIGIPPYGGCVAHCCAYILFGFLIALEIGAIWKLTRLLTGTATDISDGLLKTQYRQTTYKVNLLKESMQATGLVVVAIFGGGLCATEFLRTVTSIFVSAQWFGLPSYGGILVHCYGITLFLLLAVLEAGAVWKIIRLVMEVSAGTSERGLIVRLSGCIFYGNALLSLILTWRFISSWKCISVLWTLAETTGGLYFPPDITIKRRVIIVTCNFTVCALVEHVMSMISATGVDIPPEEYFQRYILSSHGFLLRKEEYNLWLGIVIFVLSKLATVLWNFQDLIIILISMGLTSRYHRLNKFVEDFVRVEKREKEKTKLGTELYTQVLTWRRLREAFVRQAALVRKVDEKLGKLILLCNLNNFYFICLQLFLGINQNSNMGVINKSYYFYSLGWLLFRACSVVLVAADVNLHSKKALSCLYSCPGSAYNVEVKRLENQLTCDFVALSGMRLFFLDRQLFLEVAAAIVKYELVMLQYDN